MSTVIKIENLSKIYQLGEVGTGTISHDLNRWAARIRGKEDPYSVVGSVNDRTQKAIKGEEIWALKDINLEIKEGEVLGIIGKNGAGKSTLLKILSRITSPTKGSYKIKGRMASLLEVGTGFHPEMTGRENIYMNGTIMGMRKREIDAKLDEIVDFAGILKYIDTPVKRYSSGMTVRLGFAVAAHLEPEILVVDEVLAVGDAEFQKKAIGKMQEVSHGQGRTVLFVSHNMAAVKQLCSRGVILANGLIKDTGNIDFIISEYLVVDSQVNAEWKRSIRSDSEIYFEHVKIINSKGILTHTIATEESFKICISINSLKQIKDATISIRFINSEGIPVFTTSLHDSNEISEGIGEGKIEYQVDISKNILVPDKYNLLIACFISRTKLFDQVETLSISIEDLGIKKKDPDRLGFVIPEYKWEKKTY